MDRRYLPAATFATLSALMHVIALPLSGFAANLWPSLVVAVIWAALAFGLFQGSRLVAYLAYLMALIAIIGALSIVIGTPPGLAQWTWIAIIGADALAAVALFVVLWRPRAT